MKDIATKRIILFIMLCCLLITAISCEKYLIDESPPDTLDNRPLNLTYNTNAGFFSAIPANVWEYNLLTCIKTKSNAEDTLTYNIMSEKFCLDSALLWHQEQQHYFYKENLLYRQIPLQMSGGKIFCSIADKFYAGQSGSQNTDISSKITKVKSYCIIVETPYIGEQHKYLATMFPEYSETGFNENCTYLEKGNYSGLIIFSSPDGFVQRIEHYQNGLVLSGTMLKATELSATNRDNLKFLTVYQAGTSSAFLPQTKGWSDTLDAVVVIGTVPNDRENSSKGKDEAGGGPSSPSGGYHTDSSLPLTGNNQGGGGNSSEPVYYTLTLTTDGGGTAQGGGKYTSGTNATIQACANSEYIFGGWSGDYGGLSKSASVYMNGNKYITARFYSLTSDCGKLKKALSNYDSLMVYRGKILKNPNLEYGYTKSPEKSKTGESLINKLRTTTFPGMTEMVHTHALEIHLSLSDLRTLYNSYARGYITDIANFTYTVVSPEYFIVLQIDDEEKVKDVINNLMTNSIDEKGVKKYQFIDYQCNQYRNYVPNERGKSIEEYFSCFMEFMTDFESGLSISLHKTDATTNEIISKHILESSDVQDFISLYQICK